MCGTPGRITNSSVIFVTVVARAFSFSSSFFGLGLRPSFLATSLHFALFASFSISDDDSSVATLRQSFE